MVCGRGAIKDKRIGKPKELLTKQERENIIETVKTKTPNECDAHYRSEYWTTGILGEYIKRTYEVEYKSKTSYYLMFREATFTYHKPGRVSARHDTEEVRTWRIEAKKQIQAAWDDPNANWSEARGWRPSQAAPSASPKAACRSCESASLFAR